MSTHKPTPCGNRWKFGKDECARERGHIGPHRNTETSEAHSFRWFDNEGTPHTSAEALPVLHCPAAHPEDPIPCNGPVVVTILDEENGSADGCELHAVRLLASLVGGRPVAKPDIPEGIALRIRHEASRTRPFAWREVGR